VKATRKTDFSVKMACTDVIQGQLFYAHWKADKLLNVAV